MKSRRKKNNYFMKTKLFTLFVALIYATSLFAYDCKVDGIYYNLNSTDLTAEVTKVPSPKPLYSGSVVIPSTITYNSKTYSVTKIGKSAFYECPNLISVSIPHSVTTIGESVFLYSSKLTSIDVDATNTHYCSIDGVLFNYVKDTLIQYPIGNTRTEYVVPNSVTMIGISAFNNCKNLTLVTIPNSVTTIDTHAFYQCSGLTSVTIGNSVTTIGESAFAECGLSSVTFGNSVSTIGKDAFFHCYKLTSIDIPNSVTTIESSAFAWCYGLANVMLGKSVNMIGTYAFASCSKLKTITCYAKNPPSCKQYCFSEVPSSVIIYVPYASLNAYQSAIYWSYFTTFIPQYFDYCGDKLRWEYKDGTLSISGTGDMYDFTQTTSPWLNLKNSVTNVIFPSGITSIGKNAFYGFSKLKSIIIPNSVTTIGEGTFSSCSGLISATFLGNACQNAIGEDAFGGVGKETPATLVLPNNWIGSKPDKDGLWYGGYFNYPQVGDQFEDEASGLKFEVTAVDKINTVKVIDNSYGGTSYTIPSIVSYIEVTFSVTEIGEYAFCLCTSLQSITIPASVTTIKKKAFGACASLCSVSFLGNACQKGIIEDAFYDVGKTTPATLVLPDNWTGSKPVNNKTSWYGGYFNYGTPSALPTINANVKVNKFLYNGQVIFRQGEKNYTITGQKVK